MMLFLNSLTGRRWTVGLLVLLLVAAVPSVAAGQDVPATPPTTQPTTQPEAPGPPAEPEPPAPPPEEVTTATIQRDRQRLRDDEALDPAVRDDAVALYDQAEAALKEADEQAAATAAYQQTAQNAPALIQRFRAATTQPTTQPDILVEPDVTLEAMEALLRQHESQLTERNKRFADLGDQLKLMADNRSKLPDWIVQTRSRLKEVADRLSAAAPPDEAPAVALARRDQLLARRRALNATLARQEAQLATSDLRSQLVRAEQDALAREAADLQLTVQAWREAVNRRRDEEARRRLAEARRAEREAADMHELVQRLRRENTELAALRTGADGRNERRRRAGADLAAAAARTAELDDSFEKIRALVESVGLTDAIGLLLRREREALPDVRELRLRSDLRQDEIARVRLRQFELNELAGQLTQPEQRAADLVAAARPPVPDAQRDIVLASVRQALLDRAELLAPLIEEYGEYFNGLIELDLAERRLAEGAEVYARFIDERMLWVRSAPPLGPGDLAGLWQGIVWIVSPDGWAQVAAALSRDARGNPLLVGALLALLGAAMAIRRRMIGALVGIDAQTGGSLARAMARLLWALLLSVALGSIFAGAMALAGWRLVAAPQATGFAYAVGQGLLVTAAAWWPIAIFLQVCRVKGLADRHFRWPMDVVAPACRSLRQLACVGLPLVFLVAMTEGGGQDAHRHSLGRLAAIGGLVLLAIYSFRLLSPHGRLIEETVGKMPDGWLYRLRYAWYPLMDVAPLGLAAAAMAGYYYAALELSTRLLLQIWVVLVLIVLRALLLRWILLARRRLALIAAEQRRTAEQERQQSAEVGAVPESAVEPEPQIDLTAVNVQTRRFVNYLTATLFLVALYAIWAGALPALGRLRQMNLWGTVAMADLLGAVLVLVVTVVLARNIGGVLEITLLQRLPVDAGSRFAINALARYAIWVAGIVLTFNLLGVYWSHVQWLVAAMTVGLAFGLQEIFANFVSGLIILFERPIRVGDIVTVGGVSGTVSRIRIRATTITDWDRKELIVPNKQFITGELINWTLTDTTIRIVLSVGIAYGSDTALARSLLLETARAHERVLKDPEPSAFFMSFGDSTLNFDLRVFVALKDGLTVRNDLLTAIDLAFRKAGIEIAFPQRDIHVRSITDALAIQRDKGGT